MTRVACFALGAVAGAVVVVAGVSAWLAVRAWHEPLSYRRYQLELHGTGEAAAYRVRRRR